MEEKKPWYRSKTILVQGAVTAAGAVGTVVQIATQPDVMGAVVAAIPGAAPVFAFLGAVGIIMRFFTSKSLGKA